jgi:TPR repeat protein
MMASMHRRGVLVLIGLCLVPSVARAQFYDLDGVYRCVTAPDTPACKVGGNPPPPPLPPAPPAPPSVDQIIARISAQTVSADDMKLLAAKAAAKEPRAVEALAWCALNGIGMAADPVTAFVLYGQAGQLGIPTANANQAAIFESRLTPEQRQQVLLRQQTQ